MFDLWGVYWRLDSNIEWKSLKNTCYLAATAATAATAGAGDLFFLIDLKIPLRQYLQRV